MPPPVIREEEFRLLEKANKENVKSRFSVFYIELREFLNSLPCLQNIQQIREKWVYGVRQNLAFAGDLIPEYEHWYAYNTGGRNEAQFNIGMFPDYLRIGLGFEFTKKKGGDPERVHSAYDSFLVVIQQEDTFKNFVQKNYLEIEWVPKDETILKYERTEDVVNWLLHPPPADWIFIGRLLKIYSDAIILEDPQRLGNLIDIIFTGFLPIWEETQMLTS
jgi:hypothetical protein